MNFFTPKVCNTLDDAEPFHRASSEYKQRLEALCGILPQHVLELAELRGIEDGLLVRVHHNRERQRLRLVLRCGYVQIGYYNLVLTYEDAELSPQNDACLAQVARSTRSQHDFGCDLAYHELDAADDGRIEHRLLFHATERDHPTAGGWISLAIRCRALRWRREPKRTRRLPPIKDRYPDRPTDLLPA